jgi:hypothetical protein
MISARAPGLFQEVTGIVMSRRYDLRTATVNDLHLLLDVYLMWYSRWHRELHLEKCPDTQRALSNDHPLWLKRTELLTRYLSYVSLVKQFLCAFQLDPASGAEQAAVNAASSVIQLVELVGADSGPRQNMRFERTWWKAQPEILSGHQLCAFVRC